MKRPRGPETASKGKKQKNRGSNDTGDLLLGDGRKPGLESSCAHISELFRNSHYDLAVETTRHLRSGLPERLGIRRRWPW